MAKKKKKQFIPLFEDYFDQLNLLSFDQAGRIFMLIRCCRSEPDQLLHLENSLDLDTGSKIIWSFLKSDIESWFEEKRKKSETNAANARARWKSSADSSCSDITGQKSIIFTTEQAAPGSEPVLVAHAAGMRNNAVASENDAIASPIYNINNNNIHNNNNMDIRTEETPAASESFPALETVVQLFVDNGSTKAAAEKYYNYYRIRKWRTAKGELITNLEESVKRWIARDLNFWRRRSRKNIHPVTSAADQSHIGHTAAVPAASATSTYWDGTCSRPANAKKNSLRNFEQRNYDYDALQKVLCAI